MLWYEQKNTTAALSTRIRLARNLDGVAFPSHLDKESLRATNQKIADAVLSCHFKSGRLRKIDMSSLGETEALSMVERHIISPEFAKGSGDRILMLSDDETVSIMIGEEDHLRIQVIKSGLCLFEAYEICNEIDDELGQKLKFAFDDRLGFLTECPTNLGTGMRASVMLHLPLLEGTGELRNISSAVNKIGLTFRGFYGEGSDAKASIYQLSNQITLGVSETNALENLKNIALSIMGQEKSGAEKLDRLSLDDTVARSFGILKYAKKLSTDEMLKHISRLMLGERLGVIQLSDDLSTTKLLIAMQPAMLKRLYGEMNTNERDAKRATLIREEFSKQEF